MTRHTLPWRRRCDNFQLRFGTIEFVASVGYFEDDQPAEAFLTGGKAGSDVQALTRDGSILLSLALQYGVPLDTIRHALSRGSNGAPSSVICALVDRMARDGVESGE